MKPAACIQNSWEEFPEESTESTFPNYQEPLALSGIKILIAEDDASLRVLAQTILEGAGAQVEFANDGKESVHLAREKDFDLIFMDIRMPRMNGFEAARRIRLAGCRVPLIALSGDATERSAKLKLFDDFLTKPFGVIELLEVTKKWVRRS